MKEIIDKYVENSFGGHFQAEFKFHQFKLNYNKYFKNGINQKVLDIGIGRGEMLSCMKNWSSNYHGIDISRSTVEFCKKLELSCELVEDSELWLGGEKTKFDVITCLDVLEHIPKERLIPFLEAIRNSLSDNGVTIIQVPNLKAPFGYLHHFNDITHVNGFVEHSLNQVLLSSGFKKISFHGFEEFFEKTQKVMIKKLLRYFFRKMIRFMRAINSNPNPTILDPVFFAIACR